MFRHQMQLGPMSLVLLLLIIIGRINASVAVRSTSNEVNAVTQSDDYGSDDDESAAPAEQNQPSGPKPVFAKPLRTIYLGSANKTQINCSAENFNDVKHAILWYKDNNLLVNGNFTMNNDYKIDAKMNLIIEKIKKDTPGKYVCQIMPANVNQTTILMAGEDIHVHKPNGSGGHQFTNSPIFISIAFSLICLAQSVHK